MALPRSAGVGKGWPVASLLAIAVTAPPPAGTAPIAQPVIEQTSAAGASPFTWRMKDDASFYAGYYVHVRRAASVSALTDGPLSGEAEQQLSPQDLATGDIRIAGLTSTPVGGLALQIRIGHEDGAGGMVWGPWSNILTDVIQAAYEAAFDPTRSTFNVTLTNGARTMTTADQGYNLEGSAVSSTTLSQAIGVAEFTFDAIGTRNPARCGVVPVGFNPKSYEQVMTSIDSGGGLRQQGAGSAGAPPFAPGGKALMIVHKASGRVWYRTASGYYPDVPTFAPDGSLTSGTGLASGIAGGIQLAVTAYGADTVSVNTGQTPFTIARPANTPTGWA